MSYIHFYLLVFIFTVVPLPHFLLFTFTVFFGGIIFWISNLSLFLFDFYISFSIFFLLFTILHPSHSLSLLDCQYIVSGQPSELRPACTWSSSPGPGPGTLMKLANAVTSSFSSLCFYPDVNSKTLHWTPSPPHKTTK